MGDHDTPGGGLPLNTFSKNVPPGWMPSNPKYPIRLYNQLVKLWYRQTAVGERECGPTLAGRLRGTALQLAMALRRRRWCHDREAFHEFVGEELLSPRRTSSPMFS